MGRIAVICHGTAKMFRSRKNAMEHFFRGMLQSEGSESERCKSVYASLKAGESFKIKGRPDLPPFVVDSMTLMRDCDVVSTMEDAVSEYRMRTA